MEVVGDLVQMCTQIYSCVIVLRAFCIQEVPDAGLKKISLAKDTSFLLEHTPFLILYTLT